MLIPPINRTLPHRHWYAFLGLPLEIASDTPLQLSLPPIATDRAALRIEIVQASIDQAGGEWRWHAHAEHMLGTDGASVAMAASGRRQGLAFAAPGLLREMAVCERNLIRPLARWLAIAHERHPLAATCLAYHDRAALLLGLSASLARQICAAADTIGLTVLDPACGYLDDEGRLWVEQQTNPAQPTLIGHCRPAPGQRSWLRCLSAIDGAQALAAAGIPGHIATACAGLPVSEIGVGDPATAVALLYHSLTTARLPLTPTDDRW